MDCRGEHASRVDDDLEVAVTTLHWLVVQASQDVHPRHILPVADFVGEHVVLKHVVLEHETLFGTIFLFQQRQQLRPTGNRMITNVYW